MRIYGHPVLSAFLAVACLLTVALAGGRQSPSNQEAQRHQTKGQNKAASHIPEARKIPCKTPENASSCYWTHGRLDFYTVYPPLRIWKIGSRRILAVYSGPSAFPARDTSHLYLPELPSNLARLYRDRANWDEPEPLLDDYVRNARSIVADFEVCPLAEEKPRKMRPVCVEEVRKVALDK